MASTVSATEPTLPPGASLLSASQLDQVAGGSVYYDLFYWIGQQVGAAERGHQDLIDRNGGVEYLF